MESIIQAHEWDGRDERGAQLGGDLVHLGSFKRQRHVRCRKLVKYTVKLRASSRTPTERMDRARSPKDGAVNIMNLHETNELPLFASFNAYHWLCTHCFA